VAGKKKRVLFVDYCGEHKLEIFECFWLVLESDKQHSLAIARPNPIRANIDNESIANDFDRRKSNFAKKHQVIFGVRICSETHQKAWAGHL
jgi:hypothetical protein